MDSSYEGFGYDFHILRMLILNEEDNLYDDKKTEGEILESLFRLYYSDRNFLLNYISYLGYDITIDTILNKINEITNKAFKFDFIIDLNITFLH